MNRLLAATAALATLAYGADAHAGGFELADQSASASGTASAATAKQGDPSAAWFNPAAVADGKGFRGMVGTTLVFPSLHAEASDGRWSADSDIDVAPPPYAYAAVADGPWALGVSANLPFGSSVKWPANWTQRFEILEARPQFLRVAPFFAWNFGMVRVAAGPHIDMGSFELRRGLDFVNDEGNVHVKTSGFGFGGHAAVFVEPTADVAIGLTYKSRTKVDLDGRADFTVPLSFAATAPDQSVSTSLTLPDRITLGGAVTFGKLQAFADVGLTLWSVNKQLVLDFKDPNTPDVIQRNNWSTSFTARTGAEYTLWDMWALRLGVFYDMTPVPVSTLAPSAPDSDRVGFTAGSGIVWNGFGLDAFYGVTLLTGAESEGTEAPAATYDGVLHMVGVALSYRQ
ncbi:MAG: outer membrane protein transport protein [Myxococcales bacterium]|nr:outer membrane protein transport protein [Myxococcales bacterium]